MTFRKFLFWSHLVIGVVAGIGILIKAVTGVILAYEHQIVDWAEKDRRVVVVPDGAQRLTPSELVAKAQEARPGKKVSGFTINSEPTASAIVAFGRDGGSLFLNPYTGVVLGTDSKTHEFMHFMDDMHRWYLNRPIGRPISGAVNIGFVLLALSGLYIWWPTNWTKNKLKSITLFNGNLSGKARDWNWHNVIGFWSMPLVLVVALTGVVMSYTWANNLLYRMTGNEPPPAQGGQARPNNRGQARSQGEMAGGGGAKEAKVEMAVLDPNLMFTAAAAKLDNWKSISVRYPQRAGAAYSAFIEEPIRIGPLRRSQLTFDDAGAEKKWEPYSQANAGRKARVWARYLHTGEAGGPIGQFIAMVVSAGSAVLVWTGLALSWRRFVNWRVNRKKSRIPDLDPLPEEKEEVAV